MRVLAATKDGEQEIRRRCRIVLMVLVYLSALVVCATAMGQRTGSKSKEPEDPRLKARPVTLKTKDGMELRAFYFPSEKKKEAPAVLLVHEWQGQASPYVKLVLALNKAGCAVLVPDYRGHGGSREYVNQRGEKAELDPAQMSRRDVEAIVGLDLEKAKGFLKDENNDGYLNLNALVVIGVREGCVLGMQWAKRDWGFPSVGRIKQGQDVKALVLISPEKQVKGLSAESALTDINLVRLPMMIVAGTDSPEAAEARRIANRVEGVKKRIGRGEASGFDLQMVDTALSGPSLVNDVASVVPAIVKFVTSEVEISDSANPWIARE